MTSIRSLVAIAATAAVTACASHADRTTVVTSAGTDDSFTTSARLDIKSAQFGVFGLDSEGHRVLFETDRFPAVIAAPYGWYIIFNTSKPTVVWREEFELPEPPPTWGPGETLGIYTISPDRRTAVTERVIPTRLGFIANEWRYAPGDPIGAHAMRVYIDGQLIREFKFHIDDGPGHAGRPKRSTGPST